MKWISEGGAGGRQSNSTLGGAAQTRPSSQPGKHLSTFSESSIHLAQLSNISVLDFLQWNRLIFIFQVSVVKKGSPVKTVLIIDMYSDKRQIILWIVGLISDCAASSACFWGIWLIQARRHKIYFRTKYEKEVGLTKSWKGIASKFGSSGRVVEMQIWTLFSSPSLCHNLVHLRELELQNNFLFKKDHILRGLPLVLALMIIFFCLIWWKLNL